MAGENVIGSVQILITGDTSRLQADFAAAAQIAQRAGDSVAANFTAGVAPGMRSALVAVENFGKGFQTSSQQAADKSYAIWRESLGRVASVAKEAAVAVERVSAAAASEATTVEGAATAVRNLGEAHGAAVTQIQATSAALRVLEGGGGIRAAERALTLIPGLGAALQTAFPVVGFIAVGEILGKITEKLFGMSDAEKAAEAENKRFSDSIAQLRGELIKLQQQSFTDAFGKTAGTSVNAADAVVNLQAEKLRVATLQKEIADLQKNGGAPAVDAQGKPEATGLTILKTAGKAALGAAVGTNPVEGVISEQDARNKQQLVKLTHELDIAELTYEKHREEASHLTTESLQSGEGDRKKQIEEADSAQTASINNQIANNARALAAKQAAGNQAAKIARDVAQAEIDAMVSPQARAIAGAQEDVRQAQARASQITAIESNLANQIALIRQKGAVESQGKNESERSRIGATTTGEVDSKRDEALKEEQALRSAVSDSAARLTSTIATATREEAKAEEEYNEKLAEHARWLQKINQESTAAHSLERQAADLVNPEKSRKIEIPVAQGTTEVQTGTLRDGGPLSGTPATRISQDQKTATDPGNKSALAQIGAEIELQNARVQTVALQQQAIAHDKELLAAETLLNQPIQTRLALLEEILQKQIALTAAQGKTDVADKLQLANAQLAQTLAQWKALDIGNVALTLEGAAVKLPDELGNALAQGIFQAPKKGESKGQEIEKDVVGSLKNAGQQLAGHLITSAIEKLISELVGQAAVAALQTSSQAANTTAVTANTVAVAANTVALGAGAGASAGGGIAAGAGGAASAAGSVAGGAATGFIGPLISAAGGIIGGIISSITTWAGDAKIVAAVNGTTAAVNALGTRLGPQQPVAANGTTSASSTVQNPNDTGSFNPLVNLLNGITAGGALPVSVVSISPIAPLAGIFKLFGFADGGTPAIGVPALGGERGPEIGVSHATGAMSVIGARGPQVFTPKERMSIVPNHMAGSFLASRGMKGYADGAAIENSGKLGRDITSATTGFSPAGGVTPSSHHTIQGYADGAALRMIPPMMEHTMLKGYAEGTSDVSNSMTSSHAVNVGSMSFAVHGITDPDRLVDHMARKLPGALKTRLPRLSPAAR